MANLYDSILKAMPISAFKLNSTGTGYDDVSGHAKTLTGTFSFTSPIVNGNSKALSVKTASMVSTATPVYISGSENNAFSFSIWVMPTTFTGEVSILSHNNQYDGLAFDGNNIRFRIGFGGTSTALDTLILTWPVPDFTEAYHVVATYSNKKIQLYINRELVSELELTLAQMATSFPTALSNVLYSGQSVSGNEVLVVDGLAIFNKVLSRDEVASQFFAGRNVPTVADIVGQTGGMYFDGVDREIALEEIFNSTEGWATGVAYDSAFTSGSLVPLFDATTNLSLPGTWDGVVGLGAIPLASIQGVKLSWNGDGNFTVKTSLDGTTYTNCINGQLVPNTISINPTSQVLDIRVIFTGGVALDISAVRDITLTVYITNKVRGSDISRNLLLSGSVTSANESNEPIERNSATGLNFYGGYATLTTDLTAGPVRTNLCTNPSFELNSNSWVADTSTLAVSTDQAFVGTQSLLVTPTANPNAATYFSMPTTIGVQYTASSYFYCATSKDVYISASGIGQSPVTTLELGAWTRVSVTFTATATTATIYLSSINNVTPFYVDAILLEASASALPFLDGNSNGVWTGTANASTSVDFVYTSAATIGALGLWVKPSSMPSSFYIAEMRSGYAGYIYQVIPGNLLYGGHSVVYVNGIAALSGTTTLSVEQWTHILYVPASPISTSFLISNLTEQFLGQVGLVAVYPTAPSAAQALATFNAYSGAPSVQGVDTVGFTIAELSNSYSTYAQAWAITGAGG